MSLIDLTERWGLRRTAAPREAATRDATQSRLSARASGGGLPACVAAGRMSSTDRRSVESADPSRLGPALQLPGRCLQDGLVDGKPPAAHWSEDQRASVTADALPAAAEAVPGPGGRWRRTLAAQGPCPRRLLQTFAAGSLGQTTVPARGGGTRHRRDLGAAAPQRAERVWPSWLLKAVPPAELVEDLGRGSRKASR